MMPPVLFFPLVRTVTFVLAQWLIREMNYFSAITQSYLFRVAVAFAVDGALMICDRIAAITLENFPNEYLYEPPFASA